jgi:hypothetical protein
VTADARTERLVGSLLACIAEHGRVIYHDRAMRGVLAEWIATAIGEEREACAQEVEAYAEALRDVDAERLAAADGEAPITDAMTNVMIQVVDEIATAIRSRA